MNTVDYKIERNIPFPSRVIKKINAKDYPLEHMKVGDSFLVPFTKNRPCSKNINVPYTRAKLMGMEVSCRTESKGVRIWRIK
jgi:hypothetical protein